MPAETLQFKTELKQILDIIIHSLYSHKDIFLRELISNASDAIDTLRFQSLTRPELAEGGGEWRIKLIPDEAAGTLTISDNGVGMAREAIVDNLGTIARSGTRALLETLRQADVKDRPELIGQFGVGFYSSFMVADRVLVRSRAAGDPQEAGVQWESDGQGSFSVEPLVKETRGTDVVLHLKAEDREFLKPWKLRELVKKYSDFVEHPILLDVVREENKETKTVEETLNSRQAIWLRPRAQVKEEEYDAFYQHLAHDFEKPAKTIHFAAEGAVEFRALLYIPKHKPFDLMGNQIHKGLQLYVRRVFILDDPEVMLPPYLRFVKGVVDSPDLPLNVSRELLQHSAPLEKIRSNLVNKVLRTLAEMKEKERDPYTEVYRELGVFLKEGATQDRANRDALADLLLFESTKTEDGKFTTLADYVAGMAAGQEEIYYLVGESRDLLEQSPHLEGFRDKGHEVLLLTEPIDEFLMPSLGEYKGKRFQAIDKGAAAGKEVGEETKQHFAALLAFLKEKLPEVKEVRLTSRLKTSAACLVADEGAMGAHLERLMARMGRSQEVPVSQRVLEVNPEHPALEAVRRRFVADAQDARLEKYARLLYDQAVIAEGSRVQDPAALAQAINELLVRDAGGEGKA